MTAPAEGRRRPGPARSLSRERVVAAALEIMARDGLKSVQFRAIGMALGVDHKALYTYVADKDDLLTGMFEATLSSLELPEPDDPRQAAEQLVDLMVSTRRALMANVELLHLAGNRVTLVSESAAERVWATLLAVTPDVQRAAVLYTRLIQVTIGSAIDTSQHAALDSERMLAELAAKADPTLVGYARAMASVDRDRLFESTLRDILQQAATT